MEVIRKHFGQTRDGREITLYSMWNGRVQLDVTDLGARIVSILAPDIDGSMTDVALGFDDGSMYISERSSFGAIMGRHAGRIKDGIMDIGGRRYVLERNSNGNNIHGGSDRYGDRIWETVSADEEGVLFRLNSPDGDQGFPGNAVIDVRYSVTDENGVRIEYDAVSDRDTVFNLTNHVYLNLGGADRDDIMDHSLMVLADEVSKDGEGQIPVWEAMPVEGTVFDLRSLTPLSGILGHIGPVGGGFDNTFILDGDGFRKVAYLESRSSGISLEVFTDMPAVVVYTSNTLSIKGKGGRVHGPYAAICLETQYVPGSIDVGPFESCVFRAGERFTSMTEYRFRDTYAPFNGVNE